jgi:hypothetical protein
VERRELGRPQVSLEGNFMIFGMSFATYTILHVIISLIGIASGFVVMVGMLRSQRLAGWTALFLVTTVLTSVTGFGFPFDQMLPSHIVGVISLVVLGIAVAALYLFRLAGAWRWIYAVTALAALYLNTFVGVVQAFGKISVLNALAPTQSEPPFAIVQGLVLLAFIVITVLAAIRFRPSAAA